MRVLIVCIVAVICVASYGIDAAKLGLSQVAAATPESRTEVYKNFIQGVRDKLRSETHAVYGIPVLKNSLPNSYRFYFIDSANRAGDTVTLAVDGQDMRVVAYLADGSDESYFFANAPQLAFGMIFTDTHQNVLDFDNTFQSLEKAAGTTRQAIPLGFDCANSAISNLFYHRADQLAVSFLVVIQMVFEAAKFKFIEQSVANSIRHEKSFTPNLAILSLEDNWSQLSLQIQASTSLQGLFGSPVALYDSNNQLIEVDSVYYPIIVSNVALQLYHCSPTQNYIKLPGLAASGRAIGDENSQCYVQERTTRISGRDGFCADVAGALTADDSRLILFPCGQQANQKWTFYSDQTIRSAGKCLTKSSSGSSLAVISSCSKAAREDITWDVSISGTILNPGYDLVLTSNEALRSTNLTMEINTYGASQGWRPGNYVNPIITSIIGLKQMCLEATEENTNLWLEECEKSKTEQSWALYSDGTIRVNSDHRLCVTSSSISASQPITILACNGSANQRWVFLADGTISTPKNETLAMDVAQSNVDLKKMILYPRNGKVNQQWVVFY